MSTSRKKSKGLGDRVAQFTKATRIDKLVKAAVGEDCGCDERQAHLNAMFPNLDVVQMNQEQMKLWEKVIIPAYTNDRFTPEAKQVLSELYLETFNIKWKPCSCSGTIRRIHTRLKRVYQKSCHDS